MEKCSDILVLSTYFDPRLRHFRWPGMNFVALAVNRIDPDDFAGERFSEARAGSSIHEGVTDSLELHDELLGTELDCGSSLRDFLRKKILFCVKNNWKNQTNSLVLIILEDVLQLLNVPNGS